MMGVIMLDVSVGGTVAPDLCESTVVCCTVTIVYRNVRRKHCVLITRYLDRHLDMQVVNTKSAKLHHGALVELVGLAERKE